MVFMALELEKDDNVRQDKLDREEPEEMTRWNMKDGTTQIYDTNTLSG